MPGIPREVIEHSLQVRPDAKPVKQRLRRFAADRREAIKSEIKKLLAAGFIKEVLHPEWLANPVLVEKKSGQWRMCVDLNLRGVSVTLISLPSSTGALSDAPKSAHWSISFVMIS